MKIPEFNRTDDFLGYVDIPCLLAKVKNSELPGVAFRHIAECEEDPDCKIYLRGRKLEKLSPWQQEILTKLFEKDGLAAAVTEAMKEYETSPKWAGEGYVHLAVEDRQKIKEHGIAPYITISVIVIDEVRRKVILRADTVIDGNLDEHGISIFLSKERWRFEYADYFVNYQAVLGNDSPDTQEQLQRERRQQKWVVLFPPAPPEIPLEHDHSILYGRWELDVVETNKLREQLEYAAVTDIGYYYFFSKNDLHFGSSTKYRILKCERRANWFKLDGQLQEHMFERLFETLKKGDYVKGSEQVFEFWSDGEIIVWDGGVVYRKQDRWGSLFPMPEVDASIESDTTFLYGDWELDENKSLAVMQQLGNQKDEAESLMGFYREFGTTRYSFSAGKREVSIGGEWTGGAHQDVHGILHIERVGRRVTIQHQEKPAAKVETEECWCDGEYLIVRSGLAYRRKSNSRPKTAG